MKKSIAIILILLLALSANTNAFAPNKVKSLDVSVKLRATGTIEGNIGDGDLMIVSMLTFSDTLDHKITGIDEKLLIGDEVFRPRYEIDNGNKYASFDVSDLQRFKNSRDFTVEINADIVTESLPGMVGDFSLPVKITPALQKFIWNTENIESNDSELIQKAELEFASESGILAMRDIAEWVNRNIEYDYDYYGGTWSAKETYLSRKGVCDEFANLSGAFLRIKGIPARYVSGISFDGEKFGNHGWIEALAGDTWAGVDSTYGESGYLDGTHISLAKEADANAMVNLIVTLRSRRPITVSTQLLEPEVEINSVEFFEGITSMEVSAPDFLYLNQLFDINAVIENKTEKHIIYPLSLSMHEDFEFGDEKRLVWLKPQETKTISWEIYAPLNGDDGFKKRYSFSLQGMDQNFSGGIDVYPYYAGEQVEALMEIESVVPTIDAEGLTIKITFYNSGLNEGRIPIELNYSGAFTEYEETIPGKRRQTFSYSFKDFVPGTLYVKIGAKPPEIYRIDIGEDNSLAVFKNGEMPPKPEPKNLIEELLGRQWPTFIGIGVVVGIIAMAIVQQLFFMRKRT
ncbi:MAG: transglutaminase-like domain-containing protein [Candidatus Diapherotrites archaeon]